MRAPDGTVLEGHGVRLEPVGEQHLADLLDAAQVDAVWAWLSAPRPTTADDLRRTLARGAGEVAYAVVVDGRALGTSSYLDVDLAVGGLEVGWTWYAPGQWGTRVNPTCKLLLLGHAFEVLGAERVTLKTDALNTRSRAAITRLGCSYDGTLRHHRRRADGSVRDSAYYSLLAQEWPDVRDGLRARLQA